MDRNCARKIPHGCVSPDSVQGFSVVPRPPSRVLCAAVLRGVHPDRRRCRTTHMCPEFLCGALGENGGAFFTLLPGGGTRQPVGDQSRPETFVPRLDPTQTLFDALKPSLSCSLYIACATTAGILLGCAGAALLQPCAIPRVFPLIVAAGALYAAVYLA